MGQQNKPTEPLAYTTWTVNLSLLVKLGSIVVHADEMLSPKGHDYDRIAIQQLIADPEVKSWLKDMGTMALLPVKR